MSALRRIGKVVGGYKVIVKCTGTPMQTRVFGSYQECEKFADDYFFDYLGVTLKSVHHPEGDGVVPENLNPDALETIEIEIPMNALEMALEALTNPSTIAVQHAIELIKQELAKPEQDKPLRLSSMYEYGHIHDAAQPEQEPVAWMVRDQVDGCRYPSALKNPAGSINGESQPLYTAPQKYCPSENNAAYEKGFVEGMAKQMHSSVDCAVNAMGKPWVGLTDEDTANICMQSDINNWHDEQVIDAAEAKLKEKNGGV